jgi:hypothetical protein
MGWATVTVTRWPEGSVAARGELLCPCWPDCDGTEAAAVATSAPAKTTTRRRRDRRRVLTECYVPGKPASRGVVPKMLKSAISHWAIEVVTGQAPCTKGRTRATATVDAGAARFSGLRIVMTPSIVMPDGLGSDKIGRTLHPWNCLPFPIRVVRQPLPESAPLSPASRDPRISVAPPSDCHASLVAHAGCACRRGRRGHCHSASAVALVSRTRRLSSLP